MFLSKHTSRLSIAIRKCGAAFAIALSLFVTTPKVADGSFLLALIVIAIIDHNSCWLNWFWGCPGGDPSAPATVGARCISNPNSCGMSGEGTIQPDGTCNAAPIPDDACTYRCESEANACGHKNIGVLSGGVCSATKPSDAGCEPELITPFEARPRLVRQGEATTLEWEVSNADSCEVNGGTLVNQVVPIAGSVATGPITGETLFELTCYGDPGKTISRKFRTRVYINPQYEEF